MLFAIGFYDIVTFAALAFIFAGFMTLFLLLMGLPGRIARKRNHPEADAVNLLGWVGMLGILPWIRALIWSIKETDVVDIRRFPSDRSGENPELRRAREGGSYKVSVSLAKVEAKGWVCMDPPPGWARIR